jgi:hypothetical protein
MNPTIKQLERAMQRELNAVPAYLSHYESVSCESGGRQLYGRHLSVYFGRVRVGKDTRDLTRRILRAYFHPRCRVLKAERSGKSNSRLIILF